MGVLRGDARSLAFIEPAQNGRGVGPVAQSFSEFVCCLAACIRGLCALTLLALVFCALTTAQSTEPAPMTVNEKWKNFVDETINPITPAAGLFNGAEAHVTNTDPKYGTDLPAFGAQVGASMGDIVTQNFFADFVLAAAWHEDPRYFRRGEGYGFWWRVEYAISRSVITKNDSGASGFNWSNVAGTSISAALSNAYYPQASRSAESTFTRIGVGILGTGLVRLAPEFWPDFRRKVFGHH